MNDMDNIIYLHLYLHLAVFILNTLFLLRQLFVMYTYFKILLCTSVAPNEIKIGSLNSLIDSQLFKPHSSIRLPEVHVRCN